MPLLDVQRKGQQIGRIRIGQQVATSKGGMRPARLDTFRFTTQSKVTADAIAELYGGEVREWRGQHEVITGKSEIYVTVPPRDQVVTQHYEMWTAGGCQRRCDSRTEQISGKPCLCPHAANPEDEDEVARAALDRAALASKNPPQACKPVTRISVMIPDLPGLGIFRLDTGSYYAAVEIGDAAHVLQAARDRGVLIPAVLRIDQRSRVVNGETKKYPVPVLDVTVTFRQIVSGALEAGGIMAQLPPAPGEPPRALTAAPATPPPPAEDDDPNDTLARRIQADAKATRDSRKFKALGAEADKAGVMDVFVPEDPDSADQDQWCTLRDYLNDEWKRKAARQ